MSATHSDQPHTVTWQPFREGIHITLIRTGLLGIVAGVILAWAQGQPGAWPQWTLFVLWFSFGGHWVELFFLNLIRPRLPAARTTQIIGRLLTWLIGGTLLMAGARITVLALSTQPMHLPPWWLGGPIFVGLELLVHAMLSLRGLGNVYNGRG